MRTSTGSLRGNDRQTLYSGQADHERISDGSAPPRIRQLRKSRRIHCASLVRMDLISGEVTGIIEPNEKPFGVDCEERISLRAKEVYQIPPCAREVRGVEGRAEECLKFGTVLCLAKALNEATEHLLSWRDITLDKLRRTLLSPNRRRELKHVRACRQRSLDYTSEYHCGREDHDASHE